MEPDDTRQTDALLSAAFAQMDERELFPQEEYDAEAGLARFRVWRENRDDDAGQQAATLEVVNHGTMTVQSSPADAADMQRSLSQGAIQALLQQDAETRRWKSRITTLSFAVIAAVATSAITAAASRLTGWPLAAVMVVVAVAAAITAVSTVRALTKEQGMSVIQAVLAPETLAAPPKKPLFGPRRPQGIRFGPANGGPEVRARQKSAHLLKVIRTLVEILIGMLGLAASAAVIALALDRHWPAVPVVSVISVIQALVTWGGPKVAKTVDRRVDPDTRMITR